MPWPLDSPPASHPANSPYSQSFYKKLSEKMGHAWKKMGDLSFRMYDKIVSLAASIFGHSHAPANQQTMPKVHRGEQESLAPIFDERVKKDEKTEEDHLCLSVESTVLNGLEPATSSLPDLILEEDSSSISEDRPLLSFVQEKVERAQHLLRGSMPFTIQEFIETIQKLNGAFQDLKVFASRFIDVAPEEHQQIQSTLLELTRQVRDLEKELCARVQDYFKPNPAIQGDGNCLFRSISDQFYGKQDRHNIYRQQAAAYMRQHPDQFVDDVEDLMENVSQVQRVIKRYEQNQGGKEAWQKRLREKWKKKELMPIDFYCDCLSQTTLWGGTSELKALSQQLQVPILLFTQQETRDWRLDLTLGVNEFGTQQPLLLYYNGINHYQSLIPRY